MKLYSLATHRGAATVDNKVPALTIEVLPYHIPRAVRKTWAESSELPAQVMLGGSGLTQNVPQCQGQLPMCCVAGTAVRASGNVFDDVFHCPGLLAGGAVGEIWVEVRAYPGEALRDTHGSPRNEGRCTACGACVRE